MTDREELRREFMAAAKELEEPLYEAMYQLVMARKARVLCEESLASAVEAEKVARLAYADRALEGHRFVHEALDEIAQGRTARFLAKVPGSEE